MEFLSGKEAGTAFERIFEKMCQLSGLWPYQNHITARRVWKGQLKELKSNLDFTVMDRRGRVGFFDCKTFDKARVNYSDIDEHQLELSARYCEWNVPSGLVVWLRPVNAVLFFPGSFLQRVWPGPGLTPQDGVNLGSWERFDVRPLFTSPSKGSVGRV